MSRELPSRSSWRAPDAPVGSSLEGETGVERAESGMLRAAACSKQDRGQNGAFMPDGERGSGLGDGSHGGELCNWRRLDPVKETYKPIATGLDAAKSSKRMRR